MKKYITYRRPKFHVTSCVKMFYHKPVILLLLLLLLLLLYFVLFSEETAINSLKIIYFFQNRRGFSL